MLQLQRSKCTNKLNSEEAVKFTTFSKLETEKESYST